MDRKVAEFALTIPEEINRDNDGQWQGKRLLRQVLRSDFNSEFINRQKQGFALPIDRWFVEAGRYYVEPYRKLLDSDSRIFNEVFNKKAIYDFLNEGEGSKIYFLLFLEEWLRQYENRKNRLII